MTLMTKGIKIISAITIAILYEPTEPKTIIKIFIGRRLTRKPSCYRVKRNMEETNILLVTLRHWID